MSELAARVGPTSLVLLGLALTTPSSAAQTLTFSKILTSEQARCLRDLVEESTWKDDPTAYPDMLKVAQVATAHLNTMGPTDYIYIMADGINWCGTAGCQMLIGELQPGGSCRLLYNATGDRSFSVLRIQDHGYRRFYAPCEARFDGHEYQQLHEDCPSLDVPH